MFKNMSIDKIFQSKFFKGFLLGILGFLFLVFVFKVGEMVGMRKADFSCHWSDNYHRNFGGPKQGFLPGLNDKDFMEANGVVGQVMKIDQSIVTIKGRNDTEKAVLIDNDTVIKKFQDTISIDKLTIDDMVVVIGEPNDQGQIEAKLLRVMPKPATGMNFEPSLKRILR